MPLSALGVDADKLQVVLMQMVRLVRDGEIVKASKRSGKAITLVTLLDEVPVDAARFLFNSYEANTRIDFDLDLAVQQDSQNPVYYVQYAHARICSILKNLAAEGHPPPRECTAQELALLTAPEELELIRHLSSYTGEVAPPAAKNRDPLQNHPVRDEHRPRCSTSSTTPAASRAARRPCRPPGCTCAPPPAPCWKTAWRCSR